jgi:hypothetical protein
MQMLTTVLPAAVLLISAGLLIIFYRTIRQRRHSATSPLPAMGGARVPGQALLERIDRINQEIGDLTAGSLAFLALFVGVIIADVYFGEPESRALSATGSGAVGIAFYTLSLTRLARLMWGRRNLRRDYDGRVAVVRALSFLSSEGYRVYHDVPAEGFSIDHVLVGKKGVFTLSTITRPRPARAGGVEAATLAYNGHVLFFPRTTDDHTVVRAENQAEWLSEWLGRVTGEKVAVRAVVAAPGWFIKRTTPEGIPIVNPKQIASLFAHIQPRPLSDAQIEGIAHRLEQPAC